MRTVRPEEEPRRNAVMREQHYLGFRKFCGNRLRQVAVLGERWLALVGWQAAALHCAARDRWIGWTSLQRRQRLLLVANPSRCLLLVEVGSCPGLASRVLGLSLRQLAGEWQRRHGSALLLAESFVDPRTQMTKRRATTTGMTAKAFAAPRQARIVSTILAWWGATPTTTTAPVMPLGPGHRASLTAEIKASDAASSCRAFPPAPK